MKKTPYLYKKGIQILQILPNSISFTTPITLRDASSRLSEIAEQHKSTQFSWNEYHQGLILGGFFWLHWITQIPGGILGQKYGTKKVFGLSNFVGVLFNFIIPTFAYFGYQYLIVLRMIQGFICVSDNSSMKCYPTTCRFQYFKKKYTTFNKRPRNS